MDVCTLCCYGNTYLHNIFYCYGNTHILPCHYGGNTRLTLLPPTLLLWTHPPSQHGRACRPVPSSSACAGHSPAPPSPEGCPDGGRGSGSAGLRWLPSDRRHNGRRPTFTQLVIAFITNTTIFITKASLSYILYSRKVHIHFTIPV